MDCVLMRHGIAVEMTEWFDLDDTRPLTDQGRKKVRQVAKGLVEIGLAPTHLFTSPFTRARETAAIVNTTLCPSVTLSICKALEPGATPESLATVLRTLLDHSVVLCVGHEPLLGAMGGYLLNGHVSHNYPMKKAGVGLIHLPGPIEAGEGRLHWWCTPAQLRALGQAKKDTDHDR